jgi:hypothetical protein
VLIFDEIQRAPEELLDNIIDIFDTAGAAPALTHAPHKTPVNTSLCIVIVISDLGATKLSPDMDRDTAKQVLNPN